MTDGRGHGPLSPQKLRYLAETAAHRACVLTSEWNDGRVTLTLGPFQRSGATVAEAMALLQERVEEALAAQADDAPDGEVVHHIGTSSGRGDR